MDSHLHCGRRWLAVAVVLFVAVVARTGARSGRGMEWPQWGGPDRNFMSDWKGLLSTLWLYRAGYDFKRLFTISEYYDRDRAAFCKAIQSVRECDMDMTGWLEYFVEGLTTQLAEIKRLREKSISPKLLDLTKINVHLQPPAIPAPAIGEDISMLSQIAKLDHVLRRQR